MKLPNGEKKKELEGSEFGAAYLIEKWWVSVLFYCKIAIFCYFCYYFVTDNSLIIK